MFCVIYKFNVKADQQDEFQNYWHQMTLAIKRNYQGLGSRLHRRVGGDNQWIANAQWSSREIWVHFRQAFSHDVGNALLGEKMRDACHLSRIISELEVADDFLESVE